MRRRVRLRARSRGGVRLAASATLATSAPPPMPPPHSAPHRTNPYLGSRGAACGGRCAHVFGAGQRVVCVAHAAQHAAQHGGISISNWGAHCFGFRQDACFSSRTHLRYFECEVRTTVGVIICACAQNASILEFARLHTALLVAHAMRCTPFAQQDAVTFESIILCQMCLVRFYSSRFGKTAQRQLSTSSARDHFGGRMEGPVTFMLLTELGDAELRRQHSSPDPKQQSAPAPCFGLAKCTPFCCHL